MRCGIPLRARSTPPAAKQWIKAVDDTTEEGSPIIPFPRDSRDDPTREQLAAALRANRAIARGLEAVGKEMVDYAEASFETAAATAKAMLSVRTFADLVRVSADFAKANVEHLAARSARLSEVGVKVTEEAFAPASHPDAAIAPKSSPRVARLRFDGR